MTQRFKVEVAGVTPGVHLSSYSERDGVSGHLKQIWTNKMRQVLERCRLCSLLESKKSQLVTESVEPLLFRIDLDLSFL